MKIYIVVMTRWSKFAFYVSGIYKDFEKAKAEALDEQRFRGGTKYLPTIWEARIGQEPICVFGKNENYELTPKA